MIALTLAFPPRGPCHSGAATAEEQAAHAEEQRAPADPRAILQAMADHLDQQPDFVVLKLEGLAITQRDTADIIRGMPLGMAWLSFQDVYRMALDVATRQKAMLLHAKLEKLDMDPTVIHQGEIAVERVQAEAWLKRRADAAVTDAALRDRYNRDIAGRPGPERVRASVILLPTEQEAKTVIDEVLAGGDFNDIARRVSKDPSAAAGGDLGYVTRETVSPDVGTVMFTLAPGEVTRYPVPAQAGWFVIRISGHSYWGTPSFEEARSALERDIRADATREAIGSLMGNIRFVAPTKPGEEATPIQ